MKKRVEVPAYVKIAGHDAPSRDKWIEVQDLDDDVVNCGPQEAAAIRKIVPAHFVVINSESDRIGDAEDKLFDLVVKALGREKIMISTNSKGGDYLVPKRVGDIEGDLVFVIGDMTWAVFVNPEVLKKLASALQKSTSDVGG